MNTLRLLLILLLVARVAPARPIEVPTTLDDAGIAQPDRVHGTQTQKDYFLPLPSRVFDAARSRILVEVQPSPFVHPASLITILINDRPVDTARAGAGGVVVLEGPIPSGTRNDDPSRNILKLSVRTNLRPVDPNTELDDESAWVDVLPSSTFTCRFDASAPDWTALGRLAITLRPQIDVVLPKESAAAQIDLALKTAAWVARHARASRLRFLDEDAPDAGDVDRFVIEAATSGHPPVEITTSGSARVIHLRAGNEAEAANTWSTLLAAASVPLPGSAWNASQTAPESGTADGGRFVGDLDASALAINRGAGDTGRSFRFDAAKISPKPASLSLHLVGTISPIREGAEPIVAVLLNDELVFSDRLPAGSRAFDWEIPLAASQLRGNNEVTVRISPPGGDHTSYLWQISQASTLRVRESAAARKPTGLLEAARHFAPDPFQVWLARPADWRVAAFAVAWLQRVNPAVPITPRLTTALDENVPAVVVGGLTGKQPEALTQPPVTFGENTLTIHSRPGMPALTLSPATSLGIWQLGESAKGAPVLLADGWGPAAAAALESVSAQMADSAWVEGGDAIVGDGSTPVLTFATRDTPLPPVDALPEALAAPSSAGASQNAPAPAGGIESAHDGARHLRWVVIAALWIVLSAVIVWIFEQGRRRAVN